MKVHNPWSCCRKRKVQLGLVSKPCIFGLKNTTISEIKFVVGLIKGFHHYLKQIVIVLGFVSVLIAVPRGAFDVERVDLVQLVGFPSNLEKKFHRELYYEEPMSKAEESFGTVLVYSSMK